MRILWRPRRLPDWPGPKPQPELPRTSGKFLVQEMELRDGDWDLAPEASRFEAASCTSCVWGMAWGEFMEVQQCVCCYHLDELQGWTLGQLWCVKCPGSAPTCTTGYPYGWVLLSTTGLAVSLSLGEG